MFPATESPQRVVGCSQFFRNGKTLPIDRKAGIQQPTMQIVGELLGKGDWVHVFPEGRVSFSGQMIPFKRGVGKLVCDHLLQTGRYDSVLAVITTPTAARDNTLGCVYLSCLTVLDVCPCHQTASCASVLPLWNGTCQA